METWSLVQLLFGIKDLEDILLQDSKLTEGKRELSRPDDQKTGQ